MASYFALVGSAPTVAKERRPVHEPSIPRRRPAGRGDRRVRHRRLWWFFDRDTNANTDADARVDQQRWRLILLAGSRRRGPATFPEHRLGDQPRRGPHP